MLEIPTCVSLRLVNFLRLCTCLHAFGRYIFGRRGAGRLHSKVLDLSGRRNADQSTSSTMTTPDMEGGHNYALPELRFVNITTPFGSSSCKIRTSQLVGLHPEVPALAGRRVAISE